MSGGGEGWHREVFPYPDLRRKGVIPQAESARHRPGRTPGSTERPLWGRPRGSIRSLGTLDLRRFPYSRQQRASSGTPNLFVACLSARRLILDALGARRPRQQPSSSWRKEYQGAHLDAFPRWRAGGQRVIEGGVERQPGAAVIGAVVHSDEQHLVGLHVREIVPAVCRVVRNPRGLAAHMGVDEFAGDQIVVGE